jgi:hypothetical protein
LWVLVVRGAVLKMRAVVMQIAVAEAAVVALLMVIQ